MFTSIIFCYARTHFLFELFCPTIYDYSSLYIFHLVMYVISGFLQDGELIVVCYVWTQMLIIPVIWKWVMICCHDNTYWLACESYVPLADGDLRPPLIRYVVLAGVNLGPPCGIGARHCLEITWARLSVIHTTGDCKELVMPWKLNKGTERFQFGTLYLHCSLV